MTAVYVVTAGSGDSYRIERVYLESEQAYGFAQHYNGIDPVEPVQVEEWQVGAPPAAYDGPYWRAEWWARVPVSKRRGALRHTDEGNGSTTSPSGRSGGPATRCPKPRWCAGNWPEHPRSRWPGDPRRRWRRLFWDTVTQARAELAGVRGNNCHYSCSKWNKMGMAVRHCRFGAS